MKFIKGIGLMLLVISMMYMSNWDLPKEASWSELHRAEVEEYERGRGVTNYVIIDGDVYEGVYLDGMWYEPLEIYGGAIPDELMENDNANL